MTKTATDRQQHDKNVEKIPKRHILGFGVGSIPINMSFAIVTLYLAYFYTDVFLLPPAIMGILFISCRIWDGINDPIMGIIGDRTNTRWGKFRPYLAIMPFPMIVFAGLTFYVPEMGMTGKIIWAFVTYFGLQMIKTAMAIPYFALPALMTTDATERTALSSAAMIFGPLAFMIASVLALKVVGKFPTEKEGFFFMTIGFVAFSAIFSYVTFFIAKKYDYTGNELFLRQSEAGKIPFKKNLQSIAGNRPFIIAFLAFTLHNMMSALLMGTGIYFFKYNVKMVDVFPAFMGMITLFALIGAAISPWIVKKIGKKNAIQFSNLICIGSFVLMIMLSMGKGQPELVALWKAGGICFFLGCLAGLTSNVTPAVATAVMADSVDFGEWKTGVRAQGFIASFYIMGNKIGMALGGAFIGLGLAYFDYLPNLTEYSARTLGGILILFIGLPMVTRVLISVAMLFYNLSESRMAEIIKELNSSNA